MLGWKITNNGSKKLNIKKISEEEEALILSIEKRYGEYTRRNKITNREDAEEEIKKILDSECERKDILLDEEQEEYLVDIATKHIFGFSIVEELLLDDEIEEISVIGINKPIYIYERGKGWRSVNATFTNEEYLRELVNKLSRNMGRRLTLKNPRINSVLEDGSRLHATSNPISNGEITIRKFRNKPFSPVEIISNGTIDLGSMAFLSTLMQSDSNIVIAGNTASGKTTLLNSLFVFVPLNERVILIEETPEINIPHEHKLRLTPSLENGIDLGDLVYDSLRMRPDRTIIGEIRNKKEAEAMADIMLSGQARGSYCTLHGRNVEETIQRLSTFGFERLDIESIDAMIIQRRMLVYDRKRRNNIEIRRILEIGNPKDNEIISLPAGDKFKDMKLYKSIAEKLNMTNKELWEEIKTRKKLIEKNIVKKTKKQNNGDNGIDFLKFYKQFQKEVYNL